MSNDDNQTDFHTDSDVSEQRESSRRGRPGKALHWRKIEAYWEDRKLRQELDDFFFQDIDETLI